MGMKSSLLLLHPRMRVLDHAGVYGTEGRSLVLQLWSYGVRRRVKCLDYWQVTLKTIESTSFRVSKELVQNVVSVVVNVFILRTKEIVRLDWPVWCSIVLRTFIFPEPLRLNSKIWSWHISVRVFFFSPYRGIRGVTLGGSRNKTGYLCGPSKTVKDHPS